MAKFTMCTMLKDKEVIKAADVAKVVSVMSKQRLQILEGVEKLLLIYVNVRQLVAGSLCEALIVKEH